MGVQKYTLEMAQQKAIERGGKCLSLVYTARYDMEWFCGTCNKNFTLIGNKVMSSNRWCPDCGKIRKGMKKRSTIEEMKQLAINKNGVCLSEKYIVDEKLHWQCNVCGHDWWANGARIKSRGTWCKKCNGTLNNRPPTKHTIEEAHEIALKNGGKCLSAEFIQMRAKLSWQCGNCGYIWDAKLGHVLEGTWCVKCSHSKYTIENFKKHAKKYNGKCLSSKYIYGENIIFQCNTCNSIWNTNGPAALRDGTWCTPCNNGVGEKICRYFFETLFKNKFITCRPNFLKNPKTNHNLELDGYCAELGIAFEHQGRQHYEAGNWKMTNDDLLYLKYKDRLKKKLCKLAGVKLIVIPQVLQLTPFKNLQTIIEKQCIKLNIIPPENFQLLNLSALSYKNLIKKLNNDYFMSMFEISMVFY